MKTGRIMRKRKQGDNEKNKKRGRMVDMRQDE
jgi:hypothetical protein